MPTNGDSRSAEPYSVSPDDHFVGCDAFVVPKNLEEYLEQDPLGVRRFVMKNLGEQEMDFDEVMDIKDELLASLCLSKKSKYRKQGKTDVIQCFDPEKQHGASAKRFYNYISCCLIKRFYSRMKKRKNNPLCRSDTLRITQNPQDDDDGHLNGMGEVSAEYLDKHSSVVAERHRRFNGEQGQIKRIFLGEFYEYLRKHAPELLVVVEAIKCTDNLTEARESLGMSDSVFALQMERLRDYAACFETGHEIETARTGSTGRRSADGTEGQALEGEHEA
jgi:hypothetical protein